MLPLLLHETLHPVPVYVNHQEPSEVLYYSPVDLRAAPFARFLVIPEPPKYF
jgi:hypothetical protein